MGVLALGAPPVAEAQATFTPFGVPDLLPADMTPDGTTVVGNGIFGGSPFLWTEAGGFEFLPGTSASAISGDGSTVVGDTTDGSGVTTAGRWTEATGWESLGGFPDAVPVDNNLSNGWDTSEDGSIVTGLGWDLLSDPIAVGMWWSEATGMLSLGSSGNASRGSVVSADGAIVAGFDEHPSFGNRRPARWTDANGWELLSDNPDDVAGEALSMNADGSVIGGVATNLATFNQEAFVWTEAGGLVLLGLIDPNQFLPESDAFGVSDDGSVAVGWSGSFFDTGFEAFVWTEADGMRALSEVLLEQGATDVAGWTLTQARAISADGGTVVGYGLNPATSLFEGFIATLDFGGGGDTLELSQTGSCPGVKRFGARGAMPADRLRFLLAGTQGSDVMPIGPCTGTDIDITGGLKSLGAALADANGRATLEVTLPAGACGRVVQVINETVCEVSNVVVNQ